MSGDVSKPARTILVFNVPNGVTRNDLLTHFQRENNGGGEIEHIIMSSDAREAQVVFRAVEVVEKVLKKTHRIEGNVVHVKKCESTNQQDLQNLKKARTVLVSDIPDGATTSSLQIYFQKRRNGGGEIEEVKLSQDGREAMIVFEDPEVAGAVVTKEQIIKGKVLTMKRYKDYKAPVTENKDLQNLKKARTVLVSDIPDGETRSSLEIYFQKKRNGGGEIEEVRLSQDGREAMIVFEDPEVAEAVVTKEQIIKGKVVTMKRYKDYKAPVTENKDLQNLKKARTVLVSDIPDGETRSSLEIYFQKKRNGGGEIEEVRLSQDGREATIVFEDPEVAKEVAKREQIIKGKSVKVESYKPPEKTPEQTSRELKAVIVSDIPEGTTKNALHIHFQKKKNAGGEIKKITLSKDGKQALIFFENPEVAQAVLHTEQRMQGKVLKIEPLQKSDKDTRDKRTVWITNLVEEVTENDLIIYFQKRKNGGGEIENVKLSRNHKEALIVFEDAEVTQAVVNREHIIKEIAVKVELYEAPDNKVEVISKERRTVFVSDIPKGETKCSIQIHFQKKKHGGGEIEEVRLSQDEAMIVFEDLEVAHAVVNKEQVIKGKLVKVTHYQPDSSDDYERKVDEVLDKAKTILVTDVPEGKTENTLYIHFQRKRNGGGEIEEVRLSQDGRKAWVVFENPEVAKAVVNTQQVICGKVMKVELLDEENKMQTKPELVSDIPKGTERRPHIEKKSNSMSESNNIRKSKDKALEQDEQSYPEGRQDTTITEDSNVVQEHTSTQRRSTKEVVNKNNFEPPRKVNQVEELPSKTQEAVYRERTILVSDIPDEVTETNVVIYFQKKGNGGGEVETAKMFPEDRKALVIFAEPHVAEQVLQKNHTLNGKDVRVEKYNPPPKKVKIENVFTTVTAIMNPTLLQRIEPSVCKAVLDETGAVTGIQWHHSAYGLLITGSLEQVIKAGEFLQLKMGNKCLEEAEARNDSYDGNSHELGVKNPKESIPSCEFDGHENKHSSPSHGDSQSSGMSWETDYRRSAQNQVTLPQDNTDTAFAGKKSEHLGEQMDTSETAPAVDQKIRVSHDSGAQAYPNQLKETKDPRVDEQSSAKSTKFVRYYNQPNTQTPESGPRSLDGARNRQNSEQRSDGPTGLSNDQPNAKSRSPAEGPQGHPAVQPAKPTPVPRLSRPQKDAGGDTARSENLKNPTSQNRESFSERRQNAANFSLVKTPLENVFSPTESNDHVARTASHPGNTATAKSQNNAEQTTSLESVADKKNDQDSFQGNVKKSDETSYSDQSGFHDDEFQRNPSNRGKEVIDESGTAEGDNLTEKFNNSEESNFGKSDFNKSGLDDNEFQRSQSNNQDPAKNADKSGTLVENEKPDYVNARPDYENARPDYENEKPDYENARPDHENERRDYENERPDHENERPDHENERTDYENERPDHENERPDYENERPDHENERPDHENERPDHENARPDYENEKPDHENERPDHETARPDDENPKPDDEDGQNDPLEFLQNSFGKIKLHDEPNEPSSIDVAQFIQQVYREDLETFKSQNRVDVVLSEDKRLTLKPTRGFKQSEFDEVARKLQQFYEITSKNLTRATLDLREFTADDAEKIKKSMTRQRGGSDIMIEESSPDVFTLIGNAENVEMFRRNALGALQRDTTASENKGTIPTDPMVASRKGTRVILMLGEIQKQECDAIVNFTDKDLVHKTGLPCAIREAAGEEFWKVCRDIIARNGSLITNMVTLTSAGSLPCQIVIHAILPELTKERRQEVLRLSLKETCHNALKKAKESKVIKSICFPVVTPDIANLSPAVSARLLFEVIKEFMEAMSPLDNNSIEEIRIIYRKTSRCVEEYMKEFTKQF